MTKLAEKMKTNWDWLESDAGELMVSGDEVMFLKATRNLTDDDYGVFLSDGKKEAEIKDRSRLYIQSDINAGQLRGKDGIRFEMAETLNEGLAVLDEAWAEISAQANKKAEIDAEMGQQQNETNIQLAREDREDRQQHDKDIVVLKEAEKRKSTQVSDSGKIVSDGMKTESQERIAKLKK